MTIQEMIARQQAIVSGARAAGRDLTAEERAEFDGLQRQIDAAGNNPPAQGSEGWPTAPRLKSPSGMFIISVNQRKNGGMNSPNGTRWCLS